MGQNRTRYWPDERIRFSMDKRCDPYRSDMAQHNAAAAVGSQARGIPLPLLRPQLRRFDSSLPMPGSTFERYPSSLVTWLYKALLRFSVLRCSRDWPISTIGTIFPGQNDDKKALSCAVAPGFT